MTDGELNKKPTDGNTPDLASKLTDEASAPVADPQAVVDTVFEGETSSPTGATATGSTFATDETVAAGSPVGNMEEIETRLAALSADPSLWGRDLWTDDDLEKHPVVRVLREAYPDDLLDIIRFRDETTIHVTRERYREIAFFLRDHERIQLNFLTDLTAVDMLRMRTTPRFDVVAHLYSIPNRVRLRLKTGCNDGETVPSLVPVWNGANWLEREAYDMFGIIFEGHPNLRRMLLADDWDEGFPLRKDYPLRGWKEFPVYNTERVVPRVRTRWTGRGV